MWNAWKKMAIFALLASAVAAWGGGGGGDADGPPGATQPPASAEPSASPQPEDPGAEQPGDGAGADEGGAGGIGAGGGSAGEGGAEGGVSILPAPGPILVELGETLEIDTEIEGSTETVTVVEYTLQPYGIKFVLRDLMGAPAVEGDQVVFRAPMGEHEATVAVGVRDGVTLDEAFAEAAALYADGYEANEPETLEAGRYPYPGKSQHFRKDGYYYGFDVIDVDGRMLVIHHSYPFDAGDGMGAVLHEMLTSIKLEGK